MLGAAVASVATDSIEGLACGGYLGVFFRGLFRFIEGDEPVRIIGLGRHGFWQLGLFDNSLLLDDGRGRGGCIDVRTWRQIGRFDTWRE